MDCESQKIQLAIAIVYLATLLAEAWLGRASRVADEKPGSILGLIFNVAKMVFALFKRR